MSYEDDEEDKYDEVKELKRLLKGPLLFDVILIVVIGIPLLIAGIYKENKRYYNKTHHIKERPVYKTYYHPVKKQKTEQEEEIERLIKIVEEGENKK